MSRTQILIISENRKALQERLPAAALEKCQLTGLESLRYLSFAKLSAVVIDSNSIASHLRKVSLGIRDDDASDALWQLLSQQTATRVYFLVDQIEKPSSDMLALGIEYLLYDNLTGFLSEIPIASGSYDSNVEIVTRLLTADDIRHLHQQNIRQIPEGTRLTAWAAEVAESLNFSQAGSTRYLIWPVEADSLANLRQMREEIFDLSNRHPELLFLVNPVLLPIFNELYPSLKGKTVSPLVHWAGHGAFTGETSAAMLADMRCFGAIIPARAPYTEPKNLAELLKQAKEHSLTLFSTFTLASSGVCDIIASETSVPVTSIPLYKAELFASNEFPTGPAAILINRELLQRLA